MHGPAVTRASAVLGGVVVVVSTFLVWSTGVQNVPRRIYTYQPGLPPGHSLWHASPTIAIVTNAVTLIAVVVLLAITGSLWARALALICALVVISLGVGCWVHPPGAISSPGSGLGEPLTLVGALLLLSAGIWAFRTTNDE